MSDYTFDKVVIEDAERIQVLAKENGGNSKLNSETINHWYFNNPHQSYSLWKVIYEDEIEGYATTNNFFHFADGKKCLAAFPQNVLTSSKVRGKGLFTKLYYETEKENLETNKVDCFLTFTGAMSTAIFLNKFGYRKGIAPSIQIRLFSLINLFKPANYRLLHNLNDITFNHPIYQFENGRCKDLQYFKWRYSSISPRKLIILEVEKNNNIIGYAFLIREKKKGIPILILADVMSADKKGVLDVIDTCQLYASKNFFPALFMFEMNNSSRKRLLNIKVKQRSVFLVKGRSEEETAALSNRNFDFFFGDLDYLW